MQYPTSGSRGNPPQEGLARDLSELARDMQADQTPEAILQRITAAARSEIEAVRWAAISEITPKGVVTRAASDPLVEEIDRLQYDAQDGPCLTSLRDQVTVRTNDLGSETRWPRFARQAADRGVLSMLSVQLFVDEDNLGALNLYAPERGAFADGDESTAMLIASHAAIAIKANRVENNLKVALESRDAIGQAKGVLMERYKISQNEAFDLLVLASQRTHRKLRDVADELASTGELRID